MLKFEQLGRELTEFVQKRLFSLNLQGCSGRDLNPHAFRHTPLKRTCLPFHHPSVWKVISDK